MLNWVQGKEQRMVVPTQPVFLPTEAGQPRTPHPCLCVTAKLAHHYQQYVRRVRALASPHPDECAYSRFGDALQVGVSIHDPAQSGNNVARGIGVRRRKQCWGGGGVKKFRLCFVEEMGACHTYQTHSFLHNALRKAARCPHMPGMFSEREVTVGRTGGCLCSAVPVIGIHAHSPHDAVKSLMEYPSKRPQGTRYGRARSRARGAADSGNFLSALA